jgi:hypothetical protein
LLKPFIDEAHVEAALGILLHAGGDANAAGIGEALQPRRHVDAVAEDVVLLDHDVADMDADTELDTLVRRDGGIALGHAALHVDGAAHGGDDAGELDQHAIARRLDEPAVMLGDLGFEQGRHMRLELTERAFLVGCDEPAVARDIRGHDGRQPPLQSNVCHWLPHILWPG